MNAWPTPAALPIAPVRVYPCGQAMGGTVAMFVGHYSAALAARAAEPRAPLWAYVVGAQLVDIGWGVLVAAGVEKVRIDESLPGSPLDLYHMPWTHSLPGALAWSVAGALLAGLLLKLPRRAMLFVGAVIFSHWMLDLAVHRPDLELWFGGTKLGLGLWNYPVPEQALEMGLLAMGAAAWGWRRGLEGKGAWGGVIFVGLLLAIQILAMVLPMGGDPVQTGVMAVAVYLAIALAAWAVERRPRPLPAAAGGA